jgi:hypothetical protein
MQVTEPLNYQRPLQQYLLYSTYCTVPSTMREKTNSQKYLKYCLQYCNGRRGGGVRAWTLRETGRQTVEEYRRFQDGGKLKGQAWHNTKSALCTEYVSYVQYVC